MITCGYDFKIRFLTSQILQAESQSQIVREGWSPTYNRSIPSKSHNEIKTEHCTW